MGEQARGQTSQEANQPVSGGETRKRANQPGVKRARGE